MALAIGYSLRNWTALTRFVDEGRIEAHNAAGRALRRMAVGPSAAVICTLNGSAKLVGIKPEAYLRHVLECIADHPSNGIDKLPPWAVAGELAKAAPTTSQPTDKLSGLSASPLAKTPACVSS